MENFNKLNLKDGDIITEDKLAIIDSNTDKYNANKTEILNTLDSHTSQLNEKANQDDLDTTNANVTTNTNNIASLQNNKAEKTETENLQSQVNAIVLNGTSGDSSAEVTQARVNINGTTYATIKGHTDSIEKTIDNQELERDTTIVQFNSRYPQNAGNAFRGFATRVSNAFKQIKKVAICTTFSATFTDNCIFQIYDGTFTNKLYEKTIPYTDIATAIATGTIYNIEVNIDKFIDFSDYDNLYIAFTAPSGINIQCTNYYYNNSATTTYTNKYMNSTATTWNNLNDTNYNQYGMCLRVHGVNNAISPTNIEGISNVIGEISETQIGKYETISTEIKNNERSGIKTHTFTYVPMSISPKTSCMEDNCVLKILKMYATMGYTATFKVGTIDQNNLLVERYHFTVDLVKGDNECDLSEHGYTINSGERLFYNVSTYGNTLVYEPALLGEYDSETILITDSDHILTGNYNGNYYFELANVLCPFSYIIQKQAIDDRISKINTDISNIKNSVSSLSTVSSPYIVRPDGTKIVMRVDNSNNLVFGYYYPRKCLIIGNSLTFGNHPTDNSSVEASFGMCASDYTKDWAYLTQTYLQSFYSNVSIAKVIGTTWEGQTTSAGRDTWNSGTLLPYLSNDLDLVIIQLGDNVNTTEKMATFEADATTLIKYIRSNCPKAKVLWVGCWFSTTEKIEDITNACTNSGATLVDITELNITENKGYVGQVITYKDLTTKTLTSSDTGIIAHPGDLGMPKITGAITSTLALS